MKRVGAPWPARLLQLHGVSDSKKIPEARRLQLFKELVASNQLVYATCIVDSRTIDEINILQATFKAMEGAVAGLPLPVPDFTLVDGNMLPKAFHPEKSMAIVAGDATCMSISVASIIAKVTRDNLMFEYDRRWPDYGFAKHKGYPTREHICAINRLGPCEIHRMSYAPLQKQASESPEYIE
ncbi:unnamed protein product [Ostreobium quekettii]|uniref:Ribonuclease n=1 Tax=Ostreobium quekettii TaxID=121088 RepID=A0A8S1IPD5_9CHLO|nr:unnamed protein product [Ostreobium quekettii]